MGQWFLWWILLSVTSTNARSLSGKWSTEKEEKQQRLMDSRKTNVGFVTEECKEGCPEWRLQTDFVKDDRLSEEMITSKRGVEWEEEQVQKDDPNNYESSEDVIFIECDAECLENDSSRHLSDHFVIVDDVSDERRDDKFLRQFSGNTSVGFNQDNNSISRECIGGCLGEQTENNSANKECNNGCSDDQIPIDSFKLSDHVNSEGCEGACLNGQSSSNSPDAFIKDKTSPAECNGECLNSQIQIESKVIPGLNVYVLSGGCFSGCFDK